MKHALLLSSCLFLFMASAHSQVTSYTDNTSTGTDSDPIEISSVNDLIYLSETQGDWGKSFIQTANIDFGIDPALIDWDNSGTVGDAIDSLGFSPIGDNNDGTNGSRFTGKYNGNRNTISNLYINRGSSTYVGLFGFLYSGASIEKLGIVNCDITGGKNVGGIAGLDYYAPINNCFVTGTVIGTQQNVGGLVGETYKMTISNCYSHCTISGTHTKSGIVGYVNSVTINNCYSTGSGGNGIVGWGIGITANNCFCLASSSYGGTQKSPTELQDIATFTSTATEGLTTAWDFIDNPNDDSANEDIWSISPNINNGYPSFLKPSYYDVTFFISDGSAPIVGALVSVGGEMQFSDQNGKVAVNMLKTDSIPYAVVADSFLMHRNHIAVLDSGQVENVILEESQDRYVTENGTGIMDGTSWANAYPKEKLQTAINELETPFTPFMVCIAEGTYTPTETKSGYSGADSARYFTFAMRKGVYVYGGFSGTEGETIEDREWYDMDMNEEMGLWEFKNETILSGEIQNDGDNTNNTQHIVYFAMSDSIRSLLNGVKVSGGYTDKGGFDSYSTNLFGSGIYCHNGRIEQCHITNCYSTSIEGSSSSNRKYIHGGGAYIKDSYVEYCRFDNCHTYAGGPFVSVFGGGVLLHNTELKHSHIENCSATTLSGSNGYANSYATAYGGGVYANYSEINDVHVISCKAINSYTAGYNYAHGGGIYMRSSSLTNSSISNCLSQTAHDFATSGGLFTFYRADDPFEGEACVKNCIISNNTCVGNTTASGGGVFMSLNDYNDPIPFINNTVVNNIVKRASGSIYNVYASGVDCSNGFSHGAQAKAVTNFYNNMIWGNVRGADNKEMGLFTHPGSDTQYNACEGQSTVGDGNINLSADNSDEAGPHFIKPTTFSGVSTNDDQLREITLANWGITDSSVCLDAGMKDTSGLRLPKKDFEGQYRIFNDTIDIGALEYYLHNITATSDTGGFIEGEYYQMDNLFNHPYSYLEFITRVEEGYNFVSFEFDGEGELYQYNDSTYFLHAVLSGGNLHLDVDIKTYEITATADMEAYGIVTGSGTYDHGSEVSLIAMPNEGYEFENWTANGIDIGNETPLTFDAMQDSSVVAHFVMVNQLNNIGITSHTIYPNPVKNQAIVRVALRQTGDVKIAMYDLSGQQVINYTCKSRNNGLNEFVLDLSSLDNGVYMLRVEAGGSSVHKLIIER